MTDTRTKILLTSGPIGTRIIEKVRGRDGVVPSLKDVMRISLESPEITGEIVRQYADAGADIVFAATLSANRLYPFITTTAGVIRANRDAIALARENAPEHVRIAAMVSLPSSDLSRHTVEALEEQIAALCDAGADMIFLETLTSRDSAMFATECALNAIQHAGARMPLHISLTPVDSRRLTDGLTPGAVASELQQFSPASLGINCLYPASAGPDALSELAEAASGTPLSFRPAASMPGLPLTSPSEMSEHIENCLRTPGLTIIGTCCGATPEHTKYLKELLSSR